MRTYKRHLSLLLVFVFLVALLPAYGFASTQRTDDASSMNTDTLDEMFALAVDVFPFSGTCGDNLTWEIDKIARILTISGTGPMWNYDSYSGPWFPYMQGSEGGYDTPPQYVDHVIVGEGVSSIGNNAFSTCHFQDIILPDSLQNIGCRAFMHTSMPSIEIPKNVVRIEYLAFSGCRELDHIYVAEENEYFKVIDGVLFDIDATRLIRYPSLKAEIAYTLPETVISVEAGAFNWSAILERIYLPVSLRSIGYIAFLYCESLVCVDIPKGLESIEPGAFEGCPLESVVLPNSLISIGDEAFSETALKEITIPSSVESIGRGAFFNRSSSISAYFLGNPPVSVGQNAFRSRDLLFYLYVNMSAWDPHGEMIWNGYHIEPYDPLTGDANIDGKVTAADAAAILRALVRLDTLTLLGELQADTTDKGYYSATDAARILRYLVRLEPSLEFSVDLRDW